MIAIVAADRNWAIGKDGGMLYHLPGDLKYFAQTTKGAVLVMGRATLESFPGGQPLKGRINIVLTRNRSFSVPGALVVHDLDQLRAALAGYPDQQVFLLGGHQVYAQLIDCCDRALVTKIEAEAEADSFFPDLDHREGWKLVDRRPPQEDGGISYRFCTYENEAPKPIGDGL